MYLIHEPSRRRVYRYHLTRADGVTSLCGYRRAGEDGWGAVAERPSAGDECGHCVNMRLHERERNR